MTDWSKNKKRVTGSHIACNNDAIFLVINSKGVGVFIQNKKVEPTRKMPERLLTHVLLKFSSPNSTEEGMYSQGNVERLAIAFQLYGLNLQHHPNIINKDPI